MAILFQKKSKTKKKSSKDDKKKKKTSSELIQVAIEEPLPVDPAASKYFFDVRKVGVLKIREECG